MTRRTLFPLAVAAALLAFPDRGQAQETAKPEATKAETAKAETAKAESSTERRSATTTLRVQLVITRFQGEKKVASLPYTFVVTAGGGRARMRMGVDTPIPMTSTSSDTGKPLTSFQYKNVGTNIDCTANDRGDGRYQLNIGVENSSALTGAGASVEGVPLFRRFETNLDPLMRDGQSVQTVASTDPVTGEVVKIDVTLNVVR
jgi:hypothetical protein